MAVKRCRCVKVCVWSTGQTAQWKQSEVIIVRSITWVESLDARVISRLPLRPSNGGTRIISSGMSTNTFQFCQHNNALLHYNIIINSIIQNHISVSSGITMSLALTGNICMVPPPTGPAICIRFLKQLVSLKSLQQKLTFPLLWISVAKLPDGECITLWGKEGQKHNLVGWFVIINLLIFLSSQISQKWRITILFEKSGDPL